MIFVNNSLNDNLESELENTLEDAIRRIHKVLERDHG
jgi:hypothetical protein